MNFKQLDMAARIYDQIKALDAEIIEIDRIALLVANGDTQSSFELKIEDIGGRNEEDGNVQSDQWGPIFAIQLRPIEDWLNSLNGHRFSGHPYRNNILKNQLSESSTMRILGVLLGDKQSKREALLDQLEAIGVAVR